jgi:hypothetical protein
MMKTMNLMKKSPALPPTPLKNKLTTFWTDLKKPSKLTSEISKLLKSNPDGILLFGSKILKLNSNISKKKKSELTNISTKCSSPSKLPRPPKTRLGKSISNLPPTTTTLLPSADTRVKTTSPINTKETTKSLFLTTLSSLSEKELLIFCDL